MSELLTSVVDNNKIQSKTIIYDKTGRWPFKKWTASFYDEEGDLVSRKPMDELMMTCMDEIEEPESKTNVSTWAIQINHPNPINEEHLVCADFVEVRGDGLIAFMNGKRQLMFLCKKKDLRCVKKIQGLSTKTGGEDETKYKTVS